jgi:fatty acid-binding protein DegV
MSIQIVTDSACDLPEEVISKYGIEVIPLFINVDGKACGMGWILIGMISTHVCPT